MFQSMGWKKGYYKPLLDNGARIIAILIFAGYAFIPISVLLGYGKDYAARTTSSQPVEIKAAEGK